MKKVRVAAKGSATSKHSTLLIIHDALPKELPENTFFYNSHESWHIERRQTDLLLIPAEKKNIHFLQTDKCRSVTYKFCFTHRQ